MLSPDIVIDFLQMYENYRFEKMMLVRWKKNMARALL